MLIALGKFDQLLDFAPSQMLTEVSARREVLYAPYNGERVELLSSPFNLLAEASLRHTVRYTELSPTRFKNFWPD